MNIMNRLLRANVSTGRVAGFVVSNFIGLAIVLGGLTFFFDAKSIWEESGNFIDTDYLVVNKKVTSGHTLGESRIGFDELEISDLRSQPWVRDVGEFSSTDYRVYASVIGGGHSMSTMLFFESIPDGFVDVPAGQWQYLPGSHDVPIVISKDYLALYNFGFASSAGLPQMSESFMGSIPLTLTLSSEDGIRRGNYTGRIAGYSSRLNTILVPESFMQESNRLYGSGRVEAPSRLIVDVSSPGDVAIEEYLDDHNLEVAGDKSGSSAAFMLRVITVVVLAIGIIITVLSFFILLLSLSLIMEKNRHQIHQLLMQGYPLRQVANPYSRLAICAGVVAGLLAWIAVWGMRFYYMPALSGLGAEGGGLWVAPVGGILLSALITLLNVSAIGRKVKDSWRLNR